MAHSILPTTDTVNDDDAFLVKQGIYDRQVKRLQLKPTLRPANNLSDVVSAEQSRLNLNIPGIADVLLKADNLFSVPNKNTARINLGVPSNAQALLKANNLSDVPNKPMAVINLGSTQDSVLKATNLSDLPSPTTARTNLEAPTTSDTILAANNLSDVNATAARASLEISPATDMLMAANNLSDVVPGTAQTNLDVPATSLIYLAANNFGDLNDSQKQTSFNAISPVTTIGDMIYRNSGGAAARVPIGTDKYVLGSNGAVPTYYPTSFLGGLCFINISISADSEGGGTVHKFKNLNTALTAIGVDPDDCMLLMIIETFPLANGGVLRLQLGTGSGPSYLTSGYSWMGVYRGTVKASNNSSSDTGWALAAGLSHYYPPAGGRAFMNGQYYINYKSGSISSFKGHFNIYAGDQVTRFGTVGGSATHTGSLSTLKFATSIPSNFGVSVKLWALRTT